jgi:phosphatidylglycerophosphatase A
MNTESASPGPVPTVPSAPIVPAVPTAPTAPNAPIAPITRPSAGFLWRHPARWVALGFGSGLSPKAPGTVGTLWGWVAFLVLDRLWLGLPWGVVIALGLLVGLWACTLTARHLGVADPGSIVWDEIVAIWLILWLWMPAGFWAQLLAFVLFRYFDAAKPGPVGWADRRFKLRPGEAIGWRQGLGILLDDLVAAACTLLVLALGWRLWQAW